MININEKAKEIFEQNKKVGWWDDPNRCVFTCFQLVSTEIAEATEGERKNLMDDHLPHRKMGEVGLADALIRVLDLGGKFEWSYQPPEHGDDVTMWWNASLSVGNYHMFLNLELVELVKCYTVTSTNSNSLIHERYSDLVNALIGVANVLGYDIISAMNEKLEYNKKRSDHKRENRAKEHGKKF